MGQRNSSSKLDSLLPAPRTLASAGQGGGRGMRDNEQPFACPWEQLTWTQLGEANVLRQRRSWTCGQAVKHPWASLSSPICLRQQHQQCLRGAGVVRVQQVMPWASPATQGRKVPTGAPASFLAHKMGKYVAGEVASRLSCGG